jgi:hypothetical protein
MPADDISCGLHIIVVTSLKGMEPTTAMDSGENPLGRIRVKHTRWRQKWLKCRERGHFSKRQRQQKIYLAFNVKAQIYSSCIARLLVVFRMVPDKPLISMLAHFYIASVSAGYTEVEEMETLCESELFGPIVFWSERPDTRKKWAEVPSGPQ